MASPRTAGVEGIDQWFDSFQQFEAILEGMARVSMDAKFKEELTAIEQWFKVLSESERTASLYSLLQHATQGQIKFFIAVLQQMARADPMTPGSGLSPLLSSQLKTKLSPLARSFSPGNVSAPANANRNRQFLPLDSPVDPPSVGGHADSAATLAQQRARLRAMQSLNQLPVPASAPILEEGRHSWGSGAHPLPKKITEAAIEEEAPSSAGTVDSPAIVTPSSTDNTTVESESWSSMVPTPLFPMFPKDKMQPSTDNMAPQPWSGEGVVPQIGDAAIYRKSMKGNKKRSDKGAKYGGAYAYHSVPMPTPVDIVPNSPYNLATMNAMGMSPEEQLRAVQMFVNGFVPLVPPPPHQHTGGRYRGSGGAPPKSAASSTSGKSAGLKSAASGVINRENETDPELLKDIPAWLKALRLHKYVSSFEGLTWKEMVLLDEPQLEARGVATVGARKRFLRLFETVRKSQGMEESVGTEAAVDVEPVVETLPVITSVPVAVC